MPQSLSHLTQGKLSLGANPSDETKGGTSLLVQCPACGVGVGGGVGNRLIFRQSCSFPSSLNI